MRPSPLNRRQGILQAGPHRLRCALGRSGTSIAKHEGDGATPVGTLAILFAYRRGRRLPGCRPHLPTRLIRDDDGWCDAPDHAAYNRPVRLPFAASAERMCRADRLYDLVFVLDWNVRRRMRGRGSAIFLHVAKPGYLPTEGCVAVSAADMRRLAPHLRNGSRLTIHR